MYRFAVFALLEIARADPLISKTILIQTSPHLMIAKQ